MTATAKLNAVSNIVDNCSIEYMRDCNGVLSSRFVKEVNEVLKFRRLKMTERYIKRNFVIF